MPIHQHFILQGYFRATKTAAKVLFFFDICKYFQIILCFVCFFLKVIASVLIKQKQTIYISAEPILRINLLG